ncbi:hypothetical protein BN1708_020523, partial [Verticillium longisporum]
VPPLHRCRRLGPRHRHLAAAPSRRRCLPCRLR